MTYRGRVQNGVVVFENAPPLENGTMVRVEPEETAQPARGSKQALLNWRTRWAGPPEELDRLLAEVQQTRDADLASDDEL